MSAAVRTRSGTQAAPGAGQRVAVVVPSAPRGAVRSWRRLVCGIDPSASGAFALDGAPLDAGVAYELPEGAVVIVCDRYGDRFEVSMTCARAGELDVVKAWTLKAPLGKRVVDYVGRRLPEGSASYRARRLEARANLWNGRCVFCRNEVAAGQGRLVDVEGEARKRVAHRVGTCPPPPPPPAVIDPNRRGEACLLCGGWVAAGHGVAMLLEARDEATGSRYRAAHRTPCPPNAAPGPANRVEDWCAQCGELVAPGTGYWLDNRLSHHGSCPAPRPEATWILRGSRRQPPFAPGQVRRVQVDLRPGAAGRDGTGLDNAPVPDGVPGLRVLSPTYVEFIGVVLECPETRRRRQRARVRAATVEEAAGLLAAETGRAVEARPDAGAVKASFAAVQIGPRPWLAELTGRDPHYGYVRAFQRAQVDYTNSNRAGTRGAVFHWVLLPGRVYETEYRTSHRAVHREFLRATADGDVQVIDEKEVEAWLNNAPVWPAH